MSDSVEKLVARATSLANAGHWQEAEKAWQEVHRKAPDNARALFGLGMHAYQRGDLSKARQWLDKTVVQSPADMLGQLTRATICRAQGDAAAERQSIEAALAIDPYSLPALLYKGDSLERSGDRSAAATVYRNALKVAPPLAHWPPALKTQLQHASQVVHQHTEQLRAHLQQRLAALQSNLPAASQSQWHEAVDLLAGHSKPYTAQSNQLHIPRLPAIPFYERSLFPQLKLLEDNTDVIRQELLTLLSQHQAEFSPYITYEPGQPVNQWAELNHSTRWSAFHLWRSSHPVEENLARCPKTAEILRELQLADLPGLCPNVLFSALAPGTHIPPHHGETNARLVAHLPLVVPPHCYLRVGYEQRGWTVGETLIFDDTLEHEARNDSSELRVVLIFDLWNPLLTEQERVLVQAMTQAVRTFGA